VRPSGHLGPQVGGPQPLALAQTEPVTRSTDLSSETSDVHRAGWSGRGALPAFVACAVLFDVAVWWQALAQEDGAFSPESTSQPYRDVVWVLVLFVPYVWLLWAHRHGATVSRPTVWAIFAVVAAPLVLAPPVQSHDVFEYLVYGHMQVSHGLNPYVVSPDVMPGDPWVAWASWQHAPSVYGPVWTLLVAFIVGLAGPHPVGALLMVKVVTAAAVVVAGVGLTRVRPDRTVGLTDGSAEGSTDGSTDHLLAFLLNPLVLTAGVLGAHADVALAAGFAWAMVLDQRRRPVWAMVLLAAVTLVKAYAGIVLLSYVYVLWRRRMRREIVTGGLIALAVGIATYWPYWQGLETLHPLLSTGNLASSSLVGVVQNFLSWVLAAAGVGAASAVASIAVRVIGLLVLVVTATWVLTRPRARHEPWWIATVLLGTFFLLSPWFLPWYLLGLLALAIPLTHPVLRRCVIVATASMLVVLPIAHDLGQTIVRYLPPLLAARWPRPTAGSPTEAASVAPPPG